MAGSRGVDDRRGIGAFSRINRGSVELIRSGKGDAFVGQIPLVNQVRRCLGNVGGKVAMASRTDRPNERQQRSACNHPATIFRIFDTVYSSCATMSRRRLSTGLHRMATRQSHIPSCVPAGPTPCGRGLTSPTGHAKGSIAFHF